MNEIIYNILVHGKHLTGEQFTCVTDITEMKTCMPQ